MQALRRLKPELDLFLERYLPLFGRDEAQDHAHRFVQGLLLGGDRRSVENIAEAIDGCVVRSLQKFIAQSPWVASCLCCRRVYGSWLVCWCWAEGKVSHSLTVQTWSASPAAMAGVRWAYPVSRFPSRSVRTGQQKLQLYIVKEVTASCTSQSLEKPYVFRTLRPLRLRSVPLCRSTNTGLTTVLTRDAARAARIAAAVPNTTRIATFTTRPFSRVLWFLDGRGGRR